MSRFRSFCLEFGLEKGGYCRRAFLSLNNLSPSPLARGKQDFLGASISRPVRGYGLVAIWDIWVVIRKLGEITTMVLFKSWGPRQPTSFCHLLETVYACCVMAGVFCFCCKGKKLRWMGLLHLVRTGRVRFLISINLPHCFKCWFPLTTTLSSKNVCHKLLKVKDLIVNFSVTICGQYSQNVT